MESSVPGAARTNNSAPAYPESLFVLATRVHRDRSAEVLLRGTHDGPTSTASRHAIENGKHRVRRRRRVLQTLM